MKKGIAIALGCLACTVVGGVAGYFGYSLYISKKKDSDFEKERKARVERINALKAEGKTPDEIFKTIRNNVENFVISTHNEEKASPSELAAKYNAPVVLEEEDETIYTVPESSDAPDGYSEIEFTYYSDGVLADDYNDKMTPEEIELSIGDNLKAFDEDDADVIRVRNDDKKTDYILVRDPRNYKDIPKRRTLQEEEDE